MDRGTKDRSFPGSASVARQSERVQTDRSGGGGLVNDRTAVQKGAEYFGWTNLAIGALGLFGPTVTGNDDGLINVRPGKLLGITAINWSHALLHAGWGVYGLVARDSREQSVRYMRATAGVFGVLTAMGYNKVRGREGTYMVMGMAID